MSPAVMRGFSDAYGSWKMIFMSRRRLRICSGVSARISSPSSRTDPAVGWISRSTDLPVVVLPQPDSPTSARVSPFATENDTPSTAWMTLPRGLNQPPAPG